MDCQTALTLLHPYLDGELDRAGVREFEAHVDGCPTCARELAAMSELRQALSAQAPRYPAPPSLRERVQRELRALPPARARAAGWQRWQLAASWLLALGLGAGLGWGWSGLHPTANGTALLEHDLIASHLRALAAVSPVDVVSSDRHTVKPWFAGKVASAPPVVDYAEQGFALAGGRVDYLGDQRVAVLVYRHGQHVIDVYILPQGRSLPRIGTTGELGYGVGAVELGGQPAAIVSDLDAQEARRFQRLLAGE